MEDFTGAVATTDREKWAWVRLATLQSHLPCRHSLASSSLMVCNARACTSCDFMEYIPLSVALEYVCHNSFDTVVLCYNLKALLGCVVQLCQERGELPGLKTLSFQWGFGFNIVAGISKALTFTASRFQRACHTYHYLQVTALFLLIGDLRKRQYRNRKKCIYISLYTNCNYRKTQ